jgi:hypothetical protein
VLLGGPIWWLAVTAAICPREVFPVGRSGFVCKISGSRI